MRDAVQGVELMMQQFGITQQSGHGKGLYQRSHIATTMVQLHLSGKQTIEMLSLLATMVGNAKCYTSTDQPLNSG